MGCYIGRKKYEHQSLVSLTEPMGGSTVHEANTWTWVFCSIESYVERNGCWREKQRNGTSPNGANR